MHQQRRTGDNGTGDVVAELDQDARRKVRRERALRSALGKRAAGVPTYTVPEAAALLSVSQEHLYRLIRADAFPAVPMRAGLGGGRYVVAAKDLDDYLGSHRNVGGQLLSADATVASVGGAL
jgi:excisionase family DNA binding protein